jgi:type I restriction enzyme S subunit
MASEEQAPFETKGWLYHPPFPDHWERTPLYSLAKWVNGLAFRDIQFSPVGKPVIKIAEIKGGISPQTKFTEQSFDDAVRIRPGDLLFSWSGQPETSIDAFWWRGPEGWLNQHVFRVTPRNGIEPSFFYYLLRYLKPNFVAIARNKQTTGLGHVTKRDIEAVEAAYPEETEQRAIAHILGTLDDKIELNRGRNRTLEAMARALFKDWFVDFGPVRAKMEDQAPYLPADLWRLFPNRLDDEGKPEGWEMVPASELIEFNPSEPLRKGTPAPYLDMASLPTSGSWPEPPIMRELGSGMRFRNGDTLLARITPCLENGKTAFVQCLPDDTVGWGSTEYIVMRPKAPLPAGYAYLLARDDAFREHAIRSMTGTSGRQRAQGDSVATFKLASPPDENLWHAFEKLVSPTFESIKSNAMASETLSTLRDTLLPKLISGELRIAEAERFLARAETLNRVEVTEI